MLHPILLLPSIYTRNNTETVVREVCFFVVKPGAAHDARHAQHTDFLSFDAFYAAHDDDEHDSGALCPSGQG
jgi:hypothetical protein